jgi:hypothetical protein
MSFDRTTIVAGPAVVKFKSQVFYTEGNITLTPMIERFQVNTAAFGIADERFAQIMHEIVFTPVGQWSADHIAVLWPYANPTLYSSIYGSTDSDVEIWTLAGQNVKAHCAAIVGMPDLRLSPVQTAIGEVTIRAIGAKDTDWTDAHKFTTIAADAFDDTSFAAADVKTAAYTGAWGSWSDLETEEGWTVSFETSFADRNCDNQGIVDQVITEVQILARCRPLALTETQINTLLNIQGSGIARGASLQSNVENLIINGGAGNPKCTVYNCSPVEAGYVFGSTEVRPGDLAFLGIRKFTSGAPGALFAVEVA